MGRLNVIKGYTNNISFVFRVIQEQTEKTKQKHKNYMQNDISFWDFSVLFFFFEDIMDACDGGWLLCDIFS